MKQQSHLPSYRDNGSAPGRGDDSDFLAEFMARTWSTIRRRWPLLVAIFVIVLGATTALLVTATPRYMAVARVKIDPSQSAALGRLSDQAGLPDQQIVDTEVSVMRSMEVARAVVNALDLTANPGMVSASLGRDTSDSKVPADPEAARDKLASALLKSMSAVRQRSTYIVELRYLSTDPVSAASIANAFAEQYIQTSLGRRSGTAEKQADYLKGQLEELNEKASQAEERLANYRANTGVISSPGGSTTVTDQQIAPLAGQLATAQSEAAAANARVRAAESQLRSGGIDAVSAVLSSEVIRNLRDRRSELLKAQGEAQTRYGPKHPESIKVSEQMAAIDAQLREESQRIVAGLRADAGSADARAASLASNLNALKQQRSVDTRSSAMADVYQRDAAAAQAAYNRLAERAEISDQAVSSSLAQAQIVDRAIVPTTPASPNKPVIIGTGFIVAFLLGGGALVLLEAATSTFVDARDVRRTGLPLLGSIVRTSASEIARHVGAGGAPADMVVSRPFCAYSEACRTAGMALSTHMMGEARIWAIASSLPGEGKSTTTLSLARVMALGGERVLTIDTDVRRAGLTQLCGVTVENGVVEVLQGQASFEDAVIADKVPKLDILAVSSPSYVSEALFDGEAMKALLAEARGRYDRIIIDTPPLIGLSDGRVVSRLADAVALVIEWNATPRKAVYSAIEFLENDNTSLAGVILSKVDRTSDTYGGLYYSRKYRNYYQTA